MDWELERAVSTINADFMNDKIKAGDQQYRTFEYDSHRCVNVCFHYLYDRCYKDDDCDFAHEIVHSKLQICKFDEKCSDYYCIFPHKDEQQAQQCDDYTRGVEFGGCNCRKRGPLLKACPRYLAGFCPDGPDCHLQHPRWDSAIKRTQVNSQAVVPCATCGRFHIAVPMGSLNWSIEQWKYNSCNVLQRCIKGRAEGKPPNPTYFKSSDNNFDLAISMFKKIQVSIEKDRAAGLIRDDQYVKKED
ncbi:YTH1 family protein [Spironucleus salmonicida]|uniref:YTH1 family protein n=1 Tax=Spironucleus salmonicida TaxID=348837 RepID=V6LFS1_9EUKA|nr:YTH1 family protein [Spironucleus salmonicida]|eukprot:EST43347.1 hypothetical protein SS50377_17025 [Spironucleus salmonicida]